MSKIYSYTYVSIDGVMSSPQTWVAPFFSPELSADLAQRLGSAHAMVLGRQTYTEFADFWPKQGTQVPFADTNNKIRKYVVSRSLQRAQWQNSTAIDDAAKLQALKSQGDLHITGSGGLIRSLMKHRLLDEIVLVVCPLVLGSGVRLFDGAPRTDLIHERTTPYPRGVMSITYRLPGSGSFTSPGAACLMGA